MKRQWAINGRFLAQPLTGVQRYAREVVRALDLAVVSGHPLAANLELELLVPADAVDFELRAIPRRVVAGARGHAWEQILLPARVRHGLISLCNTGPIAVRRQILCIHDVNTRLCPVSYSPRFRLLHRMLDPVLGRRVERVATVSRFSAQALAAHRVCVPDKISVVPNGHEHVRSWRPRHSAATRAVAGPDTIVVVGSPALHKNLRLILGLVADLARENLKVAVVGKADPRVFGKAASPDAGGHLVWLDRVSDDALAALLQDCFCLAFPSLVEGFGLPPLEAMAVGCPVVASDRASMPEVCADAALYAPPDQPEAWLAAFRRLRADPGLRQRLIAAGRERAKAFSWSNAASAYLAIVAALDDVAVGAGRPACSVPPSDALAGSAPSGMPRRA